MQLGASLQSCFCPAVRYPSHGPLPWPPLLLLLLSGPAALHTPSSGVIGHMRSSLDMVYQGMRCRALACRAPRAGRGGRRWSIWLRRGRTSTPCWPGCDGRTARSCWRRWRSSRWRCRRATMRCLMSECSCRRRVRLQAPRSDPAIWQDLSATCGVASRGVACYHHRT